MDKDINEKMSATLPTLENAMVAATEDFIFNHTMLRIKNPAISLAFYQNVLGMTLVKKMQFTDLKFDLYLLAKLSKAEKANLSNEESDKTLFTFTQKGILELTHHYGTENQPEFAYHDGNTKPLGFGHICFSVPDLDKAVAWFDKNNVVFVKRPNEGDFKNIAFIKDPDGYWIEILQASLLV